MKTGNPSLRNNCGLLVGHPQLLKEPQNNKKWVKEMTGLDPYTCMIILGDTTQMSFRNLKRIVAVSNLIRMFLSLHVVRVVTTLRRVGVIRRFNCQSFPWSAERIKQFFPSPSFC